MFVAKEGTTTKLIRFGQQGVKTNQTAGQREAFKNRHRKNIRRARCRIGQTKQSGTQRKHNPSRRDGRKGNLCQEQNRRKGNLQRPVQALADLAS